MHVVHVTPFYYPAWAYGGIPRVVYEVSRRLFRLGHEVTVITTDVYDENSRVCVDASPITIEGVRTFYVRNFSNRLAYSMQVFLPGRLPDEAVEQIRRADVVHMHGHRHLLNHLAFTHVRKWRIPYVFSAHGTTLRVESRLLAKKVYDRVAGNRLLRGAAAYLAVSDAERRQYLTAELRESKIHVIRNGLSIEEYRDLPPRGEFRDQFGIMGGAPVVLFLGKVTPRKGVDFLIRAFARLEWKDAVLVIAGNVMGRGEGALKRLAAQLGVENRVIFTGLLTDRTRLGAYRDADVTVYATTLEVFGLVPFESLMCGTPVIVGDDCGACEILSRAGAGEVVEYGNAIELADVIGRILSDRNRAKQVVDRGRRFIEKELSWDVIVPKYVDLYREVLKR